MYEQYSELNMRFRIADTFTDSLPRLTGHEQKATKTMAFALQMETLGDRPPFPAGEISRYIGDAFITRHRGNRAG